MNKVVLYHLSPAMTYYYVLLLLLILLLITNYPFTINHFYYPTNVLNYINLRV